MFDAFISLGESNPLEHLDISGNSILTIEPKVSKVLLLGKSKLPHQKTILKLYNRYSSRVKSVIFRDKQTILTPDNPKANSASIQVSGRNKKIVEKDKQKVKRQKKQPFDAVSQSKGKVAKLLYQFTKQAKNLKALGLVKTELDEEFVNLLLKLHKSMRNHSNPATSTTTDIVSSFRCDLLLNDQLSPSQSTELLNILSSLK